ncbi:Arc family DNA-binding protein [Pelagibacterium mangrovi]|uniref:Arc family DNA-binding protein n=1 Tax=Pelagibacterium mangrovi TaxID=3119828 RepID=UPI002FCC3189
MKIRLSPDLKIRIDEAAASNNRSLNGEIVVRLEASFANGGGGGFPSRNWEREIDALKARVLALENARVKIDD